MSNITKEIIIVYHVAILERGLGILKEQLNLLDTTGLGNKSSQIHITFVGDFNDKIKRMLKSYPFASKINVTIFDNPSVYEFPSIRKVIEISKSKPDAMICYFHTKGASYNTTKFYVDYGRKLNNRDIKNLDKWRHYMEYFVIEKWHDCIRNLNNFDICGVEWLNRSPHYLSHFSGNFWWANASYINKCDLNKANILNDMLGARFACEFFIGTGQPKVKSFHNFEPFDSFRFSKDYIQDSLYRESLKFLNTNKTKTGIVVDIKSKKNLNSYSNYLPLYLGKKMDRVFGILGDDTGRNISHKHNLFGNLTGFYWTWQHLYFEAVGFANNNQFFAGQNNKLITELELLFNLENSDIILPNKLSFKPNSISNQYMIAHNQKDLAILREIVKNENPTYLPSFDNFMHSSDGYFGNIFMMKWDYFEDYCEWLFNILFELEMRLSMEAYDDYQKKAIYYLSERLLNVWINHHNLKILELPLVEF